MTILNEFMTNPLKDRVPFIVAFLICFIVSVVFLVDCIRNKDGFAYIFGGMALFVCAVIALLVFFPKQEKRYEIFVSDDSIPYNEFTEHWKVIKNDGMIITAERIDDFPICEHCHTEYYNDFTIFCPNCGEQLRGW